MFIDVPEQVVAYYGLLVLPAPLVSAEAGLTEQVQAAVQTAGTVWLADVEEDTEKRRARETEKQSGQED